MTPIMKPLLALAILAVAAVLLRHSKDLQVAAYHEPDDGVQPADPRCVGLVR
jgi:hypothetical protein